MDKEIKNCQNCKQDFTIELEDFEFYKKIEVPPPTFCPGCRMQRRMAYRNERALYKRNCSLCDKSIIGAYREKTEFPIYCTECWWSDKWDPMEYAKNYDSSKTFLEQFKELQNKVPRPRFNNLAGTFMHNSDYSNCAGELKNCYQVYGAMYDEDCAYCQYTNYSKNCYDNLYCIKSENCYDCLDIENCNSLLHSESCLNCRNSMFLFDCRNCSDCLGCVGLRNKQYHILNKAYSREDYFKKKEELKLNTRSGLEAFKNLYLDIYYQFPRKNYHGQMNKNFSGDYIANVENTHESFYTKKTRGCKFIFWCNNAQDVYDYMSWGDVELSYEIVSCGYQSYKLFFTNTCWSECKELEYCSICINSTNLFGCIGLRNKQYCILNKQYTKEEYEILRKKIIEGMIGNPYKDKQGISYAYGEFSPIELSPFPYSDTVAAEHFPLDEEKIKLIGYPWQQLNKKEYTIDLTGETLPSSITEISDDILDKIIGCAHKDECKDQCTKAFKIINQELQFYQKMGIPLPQTCYNCRHAKRVLKRNPLKLWRRRCMCNNKLEVGSSKSDAYKNIAKHFHGSEPCSNEFETSYSPDRPEIVYCEECYQQEVV